MSLHSCLIGFEYSTSRIHSSVAEKYHCLCQRNFATSKSYNCTSEILNFAVNQSLGENYPVPTSKCNNRTEERYLNQTCSGWHMSTLTLRRLALHPGDNRWEVVTLNCLIQAFTECDLGSDIHELVPATHTAQPSTIPKQVTHSCRQVHRPVRFS